MSKVVKLDDHRDNAVVIDGVVIRQDEEGRYCLNDFHRAAGGEERHSPNRWKRNGGSAELVEELERQNWRSKAVEVRRGRAGGVYAAKELVYAYAMWVSPSYNLKVIRAYDRLATQGVAVHDNAAEDLLANPLKYIQALMGQAQTLVDENSKLNLKIVRDKPKVEFHDAVKASEKCRTMLEVANKYGIGRTKLFNFLRENEVLRTAEFSPPYQRFIDSGHFEVDPRFFKKNGKFVHYTQTMVTGKGEIYIGKLLRKAGLVGTGE
ncbi:phage antirepressor KilAC domain-containing protein [Pseudomonas fakonensis]|uniref:Phage antirepressor KilAC domain-containing protein n=1 Tax=Pseudomonas fakonensis TaxID=2842355 RepID=A0ABX8N2Q7_9PSED|nr:KilA-N domain-containing protein [Pseudomonas fakonensis]QXH49963.1 phage antirepressor KilAC domain-containing protein [Pseudomonas fakonensis]